ncbi:MAG: ABC transporter permease [Stellaceae bacterium]
MTAQAEPATDPSPFAFRIGIGNPVMFVLVVAAVVAAVTTGFVSVAPNRLVSGRPLMLWEAAGGVWTFLLIAPGALLLATALTPPQRTLSGAAGTVATATLLLLLAALGHASGNLARAAGPAARVSAGTAFWVMAGCAALAVVDSLQRLHAGPVLRIAAVVAVGGGVAALALAGVFDDLSIAHEYATRHALFAAALTRHVALVAGSVGPAVAIGFPLGALAAKRQRLQGPLFAVLNLLQTVPSIALFGLLIAPLSALAAALPWLAALGVGGIGPAPAIIALVLYALLPIVRNTTIGLAGIDPAIVDAAAGMGLTQRQVFWRIELPLALPVLLAGLRIVIVQTIGLAVVAALIGAGGLGTFVFEGLGQYAIDLVLLGALPAIFMALAADFVLQMVSALPLNRIPE